MDSPERRITNILWYRGGAANNVWAAGENKTAFHKWDGTAWTPSSQFPITGNFRAVWGFDANNIWVAGEDCVIRKYDGTSWIKKDLAGTADCPNNRSLYGVWGADPNNVWLVGQVGTIIMFKAGNPMLELNPDARPIKHLLYGVWGLDASNVWAVGGNGTILKREIDWRVVRGGTASDPPNQLDLRGIWGFDKSSIWAVGISGTILKWNGTEWTRQDSGTSSDHLYSIWGSNIDNIWAVGGDTGTILRYMP